MVARSFFYVVFAFIFSAGSVWAEDKALLEAYPGQGNTKAVLFDDIKSEKVKATIRDIDLAFEMGDGYYDVMTSAVYMVFTKKGKVAGFMNVALLSYTEDPDLFLVAALINTSGERVGELVQLNSFFGRDDSALKDLPSELQP